MSLLPLYYQNSGRNVPCYSSASLTERGVAEDRSLSQHFFSFVPSLLDRDVEHQDSNKSRLATHRQPPERKPSSEHMGISCWCHKPLQPAAVAQAGCRRLHHSSRPCVVAVSAGDAVISLLIADHRRQYPPACRQWEICPFEGKI